MRSTVRRRRWPASRRQRCKARRGRLPAADVKRGGGSVQRVWHCERERRNHGVEVLAVRGHHLVAALHRPDRGTQRAVTRVFELPARRQHWILANHAAALHLRYLTLGVRDGPLARNQLCRLRADIGDPDVILEDVLILTRRTPLGQELAADLDSDTACRGVAHNLARVEIRGNQIIWLVT